MVLKDILSLTKNASPPPLFLPRSNRTKVYPGVEGDLDFDVNFVSWRMATWMQLVVRKYISSSTLFLIPLIFSWRMRRLSLGRLVLGWGWCEGGGGEEGGRGGRDVEVDAVVEVVVVVEVEVEVVVVVEVAVEVEAVDEVVVEVGVEVGLEQLTHFQLVLFLLSLSVMPAHFLCVKLSQFEH